MRDDHPLIDAAAAGDLGRVRALLAAEPWQVNVRGWMDITPLIAATWRADSAEVVGFLLARGADPLATRKHGDGALHWAASGPVTEALAAAAGPAGLTARYLFGQTPLHVAAQDGRADVVRALLAAGADPGALDGRGDTPLDLAGTPWVASLLAEAGAPLRTNRQATPLHITCHRAAGDASWLEVAGLLLARGADPGARDEFGALPFELLGEHELRERMAAMVPSADLLPDEVATCRHDRVAIDPTGTEAVTSLFSGAVLVRWRLAPSITPVEVIRLGRRRASWGLYGAPVFADHGSVWLRDWTDLHHADAVPAELLPGDLYAHPVLSPDGRHLLVPSSESLRLIDLERQAVAADVDGFGDWSIVPRFSPDGRTVAVGNSMQGIWWLTVLDLADGDLSERFERTDGLPADGGGEIVSDVAFAPDGSTFATWVRPDHGRQGNRGLVATASARSGDIVWYRHVDDDLAGAAGGPVSASLCFTPDGTRLAVGLDTGILWLDAETGAPAGHDRTTGRVHALAAHPAAGVLAATDHGLRRGRGRW